MRSRLLRPVALAAAALSLTTLTTSCGREPTGAAAIGSARAAIVFEPSFQTSGNPGEEVTEIRVVIYAVNTTLPVGSPDRRKELRRYSFSVDDVSRVTEDEETVTIRVEFPLQGEGTTYEIEGGAYNPAGTQLFKVPPISFTERQVSAGGTVTVTGTVVYVGPGADATRLEISPRSLTLRPGESGQFTARITNASGGTISIAPIRWRSNSPAIVAIQNERPGLTASVQALAVGTATIVADLEGLPISDQVTVNVVLTPSALQLVSGGGQTAQAGAALPNPVVVRLVSGSTPVAGATVNFALPGSGSGSLSASSAVTDASGQAQVRWTLGSAVGTQTLVASSSGVPNLTVNATATAPPMSITIQSITQNGSPVNTSGIAAGSTVLVTAGVTQSGQPASGATVTFSAAGASPGFSPTSATTSSSGQASASFSASSPGTYTLTVGVLSGGATVASAQTTITVINTSVVTRLVKVSGDLQTVSSLQQFPQPVVVEAQNALSQPVSGVALDFSTSGSPLRVTTGSDGRASVTYTAPFVTVTSSGTITVTLVSNTSITVTFTYTAVP